MIDETVELLEAWQRELKSLEDYSTDNLYVQRIISGRVVELKRDISSYEKMIKSRN
ncbi:hypothetical protein P4H71_28255 [Paenibacillus kribbensis]|uniref:hypothetical protein n=1 Tax=Paenibacillus kribbensis TaxID=172713 RepID=UPI002DBA186F|nr:hypothetical protein [Paenibacillus kribbensis]MEC0238211.1 hypothetical protein [Paenibacillus kribbensis]